MALFKNYIPRGRPAAAPRRVNRGTTARAAAVRKSNRGSAMTDYYRRQQEQRKNARSVNARRAAADRWQAEQQARNQVTNAYGIKYAATAKKPNLPNYMQFPNLATAQIERIRAAAERAAAPRTAGPTESGATYGGSADVRGGGGGGSYGGGGGGGGGGGASSGGGGGGGTATKTPSGPSKGKSPDDARTQQLKDALAAVAAQYGMEEANLLAEQAGLTNMWRTMNYDIDQAKIEADRANIENMVRRGIFHSTTRVAEGEKINKSAADQRSKVLQEFGTKEGGGALGSKARQIDSAMKLLKQQKTAAEKQAESQSAAGQLDLESVLALLGLGIEGTALGA